MLYLLSKKPFNFVYKLFFVVVPLSKTGSHYFPEVNKFKIKWATQLPKSRLCFVYMKKINFLIFTDCIEILQGKPRTLKFCGNQRIWRGPHPCHIWFFSKPRESFQIPWITPSIFLSHEISLNAFFFIYPPMILLLPYGMYTVTLTTKDKLEQDACRGYQVSKETIKLI